MTLVLPTRSVLCVAQSVQSSKQSRNVKANVGIPLWHARTQYQHVSEFKWSWMICLWQASLSYHDISACTGYAAMTVIHTRVVWKVSDLAYNLRETQDKRPLGKDPDRSWCHRHTPVKLSGSQHMDPWTERLHTRMLPSMPLESWAANKQLYTSVAVRGHSLIT